MDCRITDCRVVVREGSIISVPPDHFGIAGRQDRYYGIVKKIIQNDEKARVAWVEDNTTSIEDLGILQLETSMPETTAKSTTPREVPEVVINPPTKKKPVVGQKINKKSLIFAYNHSVKIQQNPELNLIFVMQLDLLQILDMHLVREQ